MTENDVLWLEKCEEHNTQYTIIVDNDDVYVFDNKTSCEVHSFSEYGWRFALSLLRYIGCNAEEA